MPPVLWFLFSFKSIGPYSSPIVSTLIHPILSLTSEFNYSFVIITMHLSTVLAVSASLFAVGYAADPSLAFTSWPKDIQAGKPVTLTWAGADPNEVNLDFPFDWNDEMV